MVSVKLQKQHDLQHTDRAALFVFVHVVGFARQKYSVSSGSMLLLWKCSQGGHCMAASRGGEEM